VSSASYQAPGWLAARWPARFQLRFQLCTDKNLHLTLPSPESVSCCRPGETEKEKGRKERELIRKKTHHPKRRWIIKPFQNGYAAKHGTVCNLSPSSRSPGPSRAVTTSPFLRNLSTPWGLHDLTVPMAQGQIHSPAEPVRPRRRDVSSELQPALELDFVSALCCRGDLKELSTSASLNKFCSEGQEAWRSSRKGHAALTSSKTDLTFNFC